MNADFHTHSTASDGTFSPEKLVQAALRKKIKFLSVTDHDTVAGLVKIKKYCQAFKIQWISGIEISCHCQQEEIHVLAYGFNPHSPLLLKFLEKQKQERHRRMEAMIRQLAKANVLISWDEVRRFIPSESACSRPHLARALVHKGYASSLHDAFAHYLSAGKAGYVARTPLPAEKVIKLISQTSGISVLAHPGLLKKQEILEELFQKGLQGIEAYHPSHKAWQKTHYENWAVEKKLLVTGGSDFHGDKMKGHGALGSMKIPEIHTQKLMKHLKQR